MSQLLYRFIESEHYDALLAVVYLARYADHIGIHHHLCTKLRQFKQEEIEFFLPQLCHLCISTNGTESVALEEFILELCERSAHGALLTFWLFQTHLHDLSNNPHQIAFKVCQRIFNKVQRIVFGGVDAKKKDPLHENIFPVTLLSSFVMGSVAAPFLPHYAGPLAISQARRPQITEEPADPKQQSQPLPPKITRSKTVGTEDRPRRRRERPQPQHVQSAGVIQTTHNISTGRTPKSARPPSSPLYERSEKSPSIAKGTHKERTGGLDIPIFATSSTSLPDLRDPGELSNPPSPAPVQPPKRKSKRRSHRIPTPAIEKPKHPSEYTNEDKIQLLRSNYFRNETLFLAALEEISNRLVAVPKPARLSALRAELALMNHDLPVEVDIPVLCPTTMHEDYSRTTHHRVVRINPAEATVLNSAERVPYLLMVEVLRDDFDFNPETPENQNLLSNFQDPEFNKRRLFDLSETTRKSYRHKPIETATDSVFEPAEGDIGQSPLLEQFPSGMGGNGNYFSSANPPRLSSGVATMTSSPLATPRTSETPGRDSEGSGGRKSFLTTGREGPDISALAHMRAAANMLAQLNTSESKRPKHEVEAIKSKIIASMQVLEEKNFYFSETVPVPTFDTIIANASAAVTAEVSPEEEPTPVNVEAGIARMENDMKTSGVARKADREDPSAATFGEEWSEKKERIRKNSPYGLCKNWDLLSVIVKTGGDLRQETFACQLIELCGKIWQKAKVDVWVKRMRILVTGESAGLIETITNGTSIHSLKRSLVLEAAKKKLPNGKIPVVTLKDHFIKTFGNEDTPTYEAAVDAFMRSLAAYSIISYILQLKDRHNGNILIDNKGHIIHIDFGFMFSNSPGSIGFETAPFKLTTEYVEVLGGLTSPKFDEFRSMCKQAFQALRKSADNIVLLVELMSKDSKMPCFTSGSQYITSQLRHRFQLQMSESEAETFVDEMLINKSYNSYFTRAYDAFQYHSQGIY